ncbi:Tetratricopeptide repeat protein [Rhynchospora pubera]|uniref:Tetratricopeptide repeat protein n=1 Tax=Rhynchospora pubera TaxID=906938 RepID=A0AAV8HV26_9POAL|nr:Tetratricopeptide repeat protein [Rhynchospora pubera]KAJ4820116.1 Tetratricopeptide repeat protein [Rhynchospora pubera]
MAMLCKCSGEQFKLEEMPRSPESLATRDYSANASSSRVGDFDSKFDDDQVDDVESALRDTISLNYEEARALLGRLEYEKGNYEAALHVLQGIDLSALKPKMVKSISANFTPTKGRSKGEKLKLPVNLMSVHSVTLLLEAILLKSKSLEGLGRFRDAALECNNLIEIVESVWPHGVPEGVADESKLLDLVHKALVCLPKLWIQIGCLDEAVSAYRHTLVKSWNLTPTTCASLQKEFAVTLVYSSTSTGTNNVEEAILLLLSLMQKMISKEIKFDPDIINHLEFTLSLTGQFQLLASQIESLLPGTYSREERWYLLALCYHATGLNEDALNIIRRSTRVLERKNKAHVQSLLLGAKLCSKNHVCASEGMEFTTRALEFMRGEKRYNHAIGIAYHFLGCCIGNCSRFLSDPEKSKFQHSALKVLFRALEFERHNPEILCSLVCENLMQRKPKVAVQFGKKYLDMVQGCSADGWRLLVLAVSSQQLRKEAEEMVDFIIDETDGKEKLEFLRLKALLQIFNGELSVAIDTYSLLLARVKALEESRIQVVNTEAEELKSIEMEAWLDLASIYIKLESWEDANLCLDKAKCTQLSSPKYWHMQGTFLEAQLMEKEALAAFSVSLSIDPDYVPSMVSMASILRKLGGESISIARSFTRNALRVDPASEDAWLHLGFISQNEGSAKEAADYFQAAFELMESAPVNKFL